MITITKNMETGILAIDSQHRELVNRLNAVVSMGVKGISREETKTTLDFMADYVSEHFRDEEAIQARHLYPQRDAHREMHRFYIAELERFKQEFMANGPSARFTLTLNNSIIDWIVRHIKTADMDFGRFCHSEELQDSYLSADFI